MNTFELNIYIDQSYSVENEENKVCMILFHGDCNCDFFTGKVLPGGVDTQKFFPKNTMTLSARYILEGTDSDGTPTKIFIENNGHCHKDGKITTKPLIITDNPNLKWLETTPIIGTVKGAQNGIIIQFSY